MSVAIEYDLTEFDPRFDPRFDPQSDPAAAPPVPRRPRHLHAVPETAPSRPGRAARPVAAPGASVALLLPPDDGRVPLKLTRRGVVVLAALVAAVGAALVWIAAAYASSPADGGARSAVPAVVTVHSGDTLWSIAGRTAPQSDPRAEVERLRQLNHLGAGVQLQPGQHLVTR